VTYRTPLGNARGLGSAKSGAHHWWMQRLTAIALVPLTLWFVASLIQLTGADHQSATAWLSSPIQAVLMLLLIAATFHHMQLGLQVVIEDYIHSESAKIVVLVLAKLASMLLAAAAAFAVLKIAFGG
jgi:succinate dehydrogenase / fumarate reductase membrane anchor subunit